jgi:endonuclease/exonuclease/phosphatase family metal-dependent hydrolase
MKRREWLAGAAAALVTGVTGARMAPEPTLSVLTFNVLAPLWAAPKWYPDALDASLLDAGFRRARTTAFLREMRNRAQVFCLQEVEQRELPAYLAALGSDFEGAFASHDQAYWSSYLVPELPWVPNGNALIVRKRSFRGRVFSTLSLGGTGNHAVGFEAQHVDSGRQARIFSIHLDADRNDGRRTELASLLDQAPPRAGYVDIIAGDVNEDTVTGSAASLFAQAGFVDVLAAVGNREPTHPFRDSYNKAQRWRIIDHVLCRGAQPLAGSVYDSGTAMIAGEVARIAENFRQVGSDHYPVGGTCGV